MSLALLGDCTFENACDPVKGKTEWGVDTLARKMMGARSLLSAFIATLAQGQVYQGYFLQSWESDDNPDVATITLNYKGLLTGGTPTPKAITDIVSAVGQVTKDFSTEVDTNGIQGRLYRKDLLWSVSQPLLDTNIFGVVGKGFRDRYAQFARMDFTYEACQTTYRYIHIGKPNGPRYAFPDIEFGPTIDRARITLNDGTVLPRENWETFFELFPTTLDRLVSFQSEPIVGSPFYECMDVVRRTLGDPGA